MITDFKKVIKWLESNNIEFKSGRSDGNTRSWIVADLPLDIMSNFGENKKKIDTTFQFDFLSGNEGNDDIFMITILDIVSFRCDTLELYDGYMIIREGSEAQKVYLSA